MDLQKQFEAAERVMAVLDPHSESDWEDHVPEYQETVEIAGHQCLLSYAPVGRWDVWLKGRGGLGSSMLSAQEAVAAAERRMNAEAYLAYLEEWGGRYALVELDAAGGAEWVNSVEPTSAKAFKWRRQLYPSSEVMEIKGRRLLPRSLTDEGLALCGRLYQAQLDEQSREDRRGNTIGDKRRIARLEKLRKIAANRWRRRAGYDAYR